MTNSVTDQSFATDVLASDKPVLVDFWAPWCGPCQMLAPALDVVAQELEGQVTVLKMNIDENPTTPSQLGIRSIPTLVLFKGGEGVAVTTGVRSPQDLVAWAQQHI